MEFLSGVNSKKGKFYAQENISFLHFIVDSNSLERGKIALVKYVEAQTTNIFLLFAFSFYWFCSWMLPTNIHVFKGGPFIDSK